MRPRVKVLLDLSSVRTVASVMQRLMRAATPWAGMKSASIITLADPLMDAIWRKFVVEAGGEANLFPVREEEEWLEWYKKPKPDDSETLLLETVSADVSAFDDNNANVGDLGNLAFINALVGRIPALLGLHTKAELSERLAGFQVTQEPAASVRTPLGLSIERKRQTIVQRVKDLAQADSPYNPDDPEPFRARCKHWMNRAKTVAGVPLQVELGDIVNESTLDVMLNVLLPREVSDAKSAH